MKPGAFPIIVANTGRKLYLRWCGDRALFKRLAEASEADDVVYQNTDEMLIEISLHDTAEAAQHEADKNKAAMLAMMAGVRGAA